jgi:amidophosphoribosyltransferase
MCGLAGLICGDKRRSRNELEKLVDIFTRLLLFSEHRGPHATGAAWVKTDGAYLVVKHPLPAQQFVCTADYNMLLNGVNEQVTLLLGHTRWPTRGSELDPSNNHPLLAGHTLTTHNGHIKGVDAWFRRWGLPRQAEVDSELLAQLACRHASDKGINLEALCHNLSQLKGRMSAVLVDCMQPTCVILLKGNMPLEVYWHPQMRVWAYASEAGILGQAQDNEPRWERVPFPVNHALVVNTMRDASIMFIPFAFSG